MKCGYLATYILVDKKMTKLLKKGRLKVVLKIPLKREAAKIMNSTKAFDIFKIPKLLISEEKQLTKS